MPSNIDTSAGDYWHYEQCVGGNKECPTCHAKMVVQWANEVMTSEPPQQRWGWYCGCGHRELVGIHVHENSVHDEWKAANAK